MALDAGSVLVGVELGGLTTFTSGWKAAVVVVARATSAMLGAMQDVVKQTAAAGDEVQKMGQRTKFSAQSLSEIKHALDQSGSSLAEFEIGMRGMLRAQRDAINGSKLQVKAFADLGISIDQLKKIQPEQLFERVRDGLVGIDNGAKQAGLSMQLFGLSGNKLLPVLNSNIDAMREQARILGITFSDSQANDAAAYTDALDVLKKAVWGVAQQIGAALLPHLTNLYKTLAVLIVRTRDWVVSMGQIIVGFAKMVPAIEKFVNDVDSGVQFIISGFRAFSFVVSEIMGQVVMAVAVSFSKMFNDIALGFEGMYENIGKLPFIGEEAQASLLRVSDGMSQVALTMLETSEGAVNALKVGLQDTATFALDVVGALAGVNDEFFKTLGGVAGGAAPGAPQLPPLDDEAKERKALLDKIKDENGKTAKVMSGQWQGYVGGVTRGLGQILAGAQQTFGGILKSLLSSLGPMAMEEGIYHVLAGSAMAHAPGMQAAGRARIAAGWRLTAWGALASAVGGMVGGGGGDAGTEASGSGGADAGFCNRQHRWLGLDHAGGHYGGSGLCTSRHGGSQGCHRLHRRAARQN